MTENILLLIGEQFWEFNLYEGNHAAFDLLDADDVRRNSPSLEWDNELKIHIEEVPWIEMYFPDLNCSVTVLGKPLHAANTLPV